MTPKIERRSPRKTASPAGQVAAKAMLLSGPSGAVWIGVGSKHTTDQRRRGSMIFITTYKLKPLLSKKETGKLMEVFGSESSGPGTTAHYVAADGSHGVVITESDDIEAAYRNILNYTEWVEYDTRLGSSVRGDVPGQPGLGGWTRTR
jgi:hypothetical protein